jgi:hypothetical protein
VFVVVVGWVFVRDVVSAARNSVSIQETTNINFAAVSQGIVADDDQLAANLDRLIKDSAAMSRPAYVAQLRVLATESAGLVPRVDRVRTPAVAGNIQDRLVQLTEARVALTQCVVSYLATASRVEVAKVGCSSWSQALRDNRAASQAWNATRNYLRHRPGHATLRATHDNELARVTTSLLDGVASQSQLASTGGLSLALVSVSPTPLPSTNGTLIMQPVSSAVVSVVVANSADVAARGSVIITFRPTNSSQPVTRCELSLRVAHQSSLTGSCRIPLILGEHAHLSATLTGALQPGGPSNYNLLIEVTGEPSSSQLAG